MLAENIKSLRKLRKLTQSDLAERLGINRSAIGAYEEGRAEPRLATLRLLSALFECSLDDLVSGHIDLAKGFSDVKGKSLRILPIVVDNEDKEQMSLVPIKASAGYAHGYGDVEFIRRLPHFRMPFIELSANRSYRVFQIKGDSMLPVSPGSYIMCEYVPDWNEIRSDDCYVVVTREDGVVYKRLINRLNENNTILLKSDNILYEPYSISSSNILEVWKAKGFVSFRLPDSSEGLNSIRHVSDVLHEIREDVRSIRQKTQD